MRHLGFFTANKSDLSWDYWDFKFATNAAAFCSKEDLIWKLKFHQTSAAFSIILAQFALGEECPLSLMCHKAAQCLPKPSSVVHTANFSVKAGRGSSSQQISFVYLCPKMHLLLIYLVKILHATPSNVWECARIQKLRSSGRDQDGGKGGSRISGIFCGEDEPATGRRGTAWAARSV